MTEHKEIQKGTHIDIFNSIVKSGKDYVAVLSCTSVDRDGDEVSVEALRKIAKDDDYTVILVDHANKIENQIGEWTDKRVVKTGDTHALVATPKFYESNPKAQYIKNMLDEGAKMGISIGAKVVKYTKKDSEQNGWPTYIYEELELLEASFVAIPSNRHGQAMAVAKSLKQKTKREDTNKMSEDKVYTQKEFDSKFAEIKTDLEKKLSDKEKEFNDYKAESEVKLAEATKSLEENKVVLEENVEKLKELEALKVFKAKAEEAETKTETEEDVAKNEEAELKANYAKGNLRV